MMTDYVEPDPERDGQDQHIADQAATAADVAAQDSGELRPTPATDLFPYTWRELDAGAPEFDAYRSQDDPCQITYNGVPMAIAFGRVNAHRICTGLNLAHIAGRMVA